MKGDNEIRKKHGIPESVDIKVTDYSKLSDRQVINRIKELESNFKAQDETFEDASRLNELNILRQEVQRRKLQVQA